MFQAKARKERLDVVKSLMACKPKPGASIYAFVLEMKGYFDRLESLNMVFNAELSINIILSGLPDDYNQFVLSYQMNGKETKRKTSHSNWKGKAVKGKSDRGSKRKAESEIAPTSDPKEAEVEAWRAQLVMGNMKITPVTRIGKYELMLKSRVRIDLNIAVIFQDGYKFLFDNENEDILVYSNGYFMFKASPCKCIYEIAECISHNGNVIFNVGSSNKLDKSKLWHSCLGHVKKKCIAQLQKDGVSKSFDFKLDDVCESCLLGQVSYNTLSELNEPANYKEAMASPEAAKWKEAIKREIRSMYDNQVWNLVETTPGLKTVGCKWIFKKKTDDEVSFYTLFQGSISTWEDLTTRFFAQFFPPGRTVKLCNDILIRTIDQSAGGKLRDRIAKESWALLEDLALYDNESWNDPMDFANPIKAIYLPQDVSSTFDRLLIDLETQVQRLMEAYIAPMQPTQVNKIPSLCEIYNGPHNTQYCMENPEQALVPRLPTKQEEDEAKEEGNVKYSTTEYKDHEMTVEIKEEFKEETKEEIKEEEEDSPKHFDAFPTIHFKKKQAYLDMESSINVMSKLYYNWIMSNMLEPRRKPSNPKKICNFMGRVEGLKFFVGNFTYKYDFVVLKDTTSVIDHDVGSFVFGKLFMEASGLVYNKKEGTLAFEKDKEKILFKMPHKMEMFKHIDFTDINPIAYLFSS
nr:retrotransposon protein, putative, Ty1-copia subclass [Tanacetum cinerariifolium]